MGHMETLGPLLDASSNTHQHDYDIFLIHINCPLPLLLGWGVERSPMQTMLFGRCLGSN